MRTSRFLACLLLASALTAADQTPLILVPPFENLSGRIIDITPDDRVATPKPDISVVVTTQPPAVERKVIHDRLTDAPRAVLEDAIVKVPGTKVVERSRADGLLTDQTPAERARDPAFATRLAQATGAKAVALGTITQISGSGISTTADVRVRLISADGTVVFSQTASGTADVPADAEFSAVRAAILTLAADPDFQAALQPTATPPKADGKTVDVLFKPSESHCELEIDGLLIGHTPGRFPLPEGRAVRVRISKAGFQTWDRKIMPSKDLQLTPELAPSPR
jgi:hypothetical protein